MTPQLPWALVSSILFLATVGCSYVRAVGEEGPKGDTHLSMEGTSDKMDIEGRPSSSLKEEHQLRSKRFIWTLTQEPYFYGATDGSHVSQGSELLPDPLPVRKPSAMHKRLYPRWYQAYVYKTPSFNHRARPVGERKRFQPFHPMARFRGLSMGGGSSSTGGYHYDFPLSDQPGHPVPSAPNAQPSPKYNPEDKIAEEEDLEAEDEENVRAGELLQYLKSIASDRGLSGNTKSFRFGISRRK